MKASTAVIVARHALAASRSICPADSGRVRVRRERTVGLDDADRGGRPVWARAPVLAERGVLDRHGDTWLLRELDTRDLPGARADRCLVLENHQVVRRLWDYPESWSEMPAQQLQALIEGRA